MTELAGAPKFIELICKLYTNEFMRLGKYVKNIRSRKTKKTWVNSKSFDSDEKSSKM